MESSPAQKHFKLLVWHLSFNNLNITYRNYHLIATVDCMKMRWLVITPIHVNFDSSKHANGRHAYLQSIHPHYEDTPSKRVPGHHCTASRRNQAGSAEGYAGGGAAGRQNRRGPHGFGKSCERLRTVCRIIATLSAMARARGAREA